MTCERRFTTYERIAPPEVKVLKRDGTTQAFDREKLDRVLRKIARGRPVGRKAADDLVRGLELELASSEEPTIKSSDLARRVLAKLSELDPVCAQRFAASYLDEDGVIRTDDKAVSPQLTLFGPPDEAPRRRKK
jgi:transcriptional repressor NrdR